FGEAVAAWEMMLKLLPAGDARRAVIERSIRRALDKKPPAGPGAGRHRAWLSQRYAKA
ncbi:hypothetical protein QJ421_09465, partial [Salmonella enterica]|nr:hypothetical protein [Salmonella enterica]